MKYLTLILMLLVGCATSQTPQQAAPTVQASPVQQYGHISPIQLPPGEYWDGFYTMPTVYGPLSSQRDIPEKLFFATTTAHHDHAVGGCTHTLRDASGVPVLIVKD